MVDHFGALHDCGTPHEFDARANKEFAQCSFTMHRYDIISSERCSLQGTATCNSHCDVRKKNGQRFYVRCLVSTLVYNAEYVCHLLQLCY